MTATVKWEATTWCARVGEKDDTLEVVLTGGFFRWYSMIRFPASATRQGVTGIASTLAEAQAAAIAAYEENKK